MNPYKNISVLRDQPEKEKYMKSQVAEIELLIKKEEQLQQENKRLHHLTNVLIQHIWKTGDKGLPLKEIDKQMKLFDDGGMDGTPRNA
tara:strand:- start:382 stop:645 length:264 start_codon:yes stop_codon:yes gene_type:complete